MEIGQALPIQWTWWRHQMETFSALLAICVGNSSVTGEIPAKGQWRELWVFFCAWINGWVNNRGNGDLRFRRAHYDVNAMMCETRSRLGPEFSWSYDLVDHSPKRYHGAKAIAQEKYNWNNMI